ncbi:hypothetical protein PROFUN_13414 [Planoprotostelium fungivorum]|uniref:Uncharacterized protein n=1 Tax=Planoprotostelium fungivorum TaxID=1890364 RepID=A0A2P6N3Q6_9EUKA|nr:hypothetical protein PROFUN_13414 [Planoprotostelium fungivorum]
MEATAPRRNIRKLQHLRLCPSNGLLLLAWSCGPLVSLDEQRSPVAEEEECCLQPYLSGSIKFKLLGQLVYLEWSVATVSFPQSWLHYLQDMNQTYGYDFFVNFQGHETQPK